ncbi:ATP-binding protein [Natrinema sp. 74]|uniref:ATP-binding protein n=1 Tax=Natrinema sp. 74 TaxID=3384159 RepID=UPI0038D38425
MTLDTTSTQLNRRPTKTSRGATASYKDEYTGPVELGLLQRLSLRLGADDLSQAEWRRIFEDNGSLQLARNGMTDDDWREAIATVIAALARLEERTFLGLDEAHRLAPQDKDYPDAFDTLVTTWHGDGMGVAWVTQRFAKLDEDIALQCQASMLGGFGSGNDLDKVRGIVEYPADVHKADAETCLQTLPDELLIDGDPLTLQRFTDAEGNTIGSEWIYSDDTTLRRIDSRDWTLKSTYYESDRVRIKHPFND